MEEFGENLFIAEGEVRFYGARLDTRMAVVRLSDGRLFVYSPVFLDDAVRRALDELGPVAFVVSPNKIHNQTLDAYRHAYPGAKLLAPPGLPERRPDLAFDGVLGEMTDPGWGAELSGVVTAGNVFFSEAVFLHPRSRTLLVGDLVENIDSASLSRPARLAARLFGVPFRPAASPEFRFYTHDLEAARASLDQVRRFDFDRIFLCHGHLIDARARDVFGEVCDELLARVERRSALSRALTAKAAAFQ